LEHFSIRKEMILNQLLDFVLICSQFLEHFQTRSDHEGRGKNPKWRFNESQEMALVCARRIEMAAEVNGALGFDRSHRDVATGVIWACTVHNKSPEITECTNGPQ
jgi:hypothetical protein